ncbi:MFS transporter [Microseira sp. BLCC-F43]|jgi:MFS family permease|uniref:MFS transporter n=1 Tax=Microseira sp. BLCC-F43 TaxID=3153602 RepID=UPI0035B84CEA
MSISQDLLDEQIQKEVPSAARLAVAALFYIQGAVFANWVARIPTVQQKLELSDGELGRVLLGMAIGAVVTMPATGWLLARFDSRLVTTTAVLGYCMVLLLLALAPNEPLLEVSLLLFGAFNGATDVSINAQGIDVEKRYGRPIMSSFHGMFSVGGMSCAAGSGLLAYLGVDPVLHLLGTGLLLGIVGLAASNWLLSADIETDSHEEPVFAIPTGALLGLGVVAFCGLLGEGAMADWSAIYLQNTINTGPGLAAAGYVVFSMTMAVGRFIGDWLTQHLGSVWMIRLGGIVASGGLALSLLITHPVTALIGFACVGMGLASIGPIVLSAAGITPGIAPGLALAAVTTAGYFGFLCGPPLIGFAADLIDLRGALGIIVILNAIVAVLAKTVLRAAPSENS